MRHVQQSQTLKLQSDEARVVVVADSRYLPRHQPSEEERRERDMVVLHELAHMWFGNLVTLRWWDGL